MARGRGRGRGGGGGGAGSDNLQSELCIETLKQQLVCVIFLNNLEAFE